VQRLGHTHVLDARQTLVTGLTRDGTRLIEDGAITGAAGDVRFTGEVLGLLNGVQALGARPRLVSSTGFRGPRFGAGVVCPPVRVAGLRVARPEPYAPGP
jgi:predicted Zn-dependent protease